MSAIYKPRSGVGGSAFVGGQTLSINHWDVSFQANIIDAPSFTSAPWVDHAVGLKRARITISGTWNDLQNPFSVGIKIGASVGCILGIAGAVDSTFTALCESYDVTDDVDGLCEYTMVLVADYEFEDFSATLA